VSGIILMPGKRRSYSGGGDRALAAGLLRIQKAKRAAGIMKRARNMGLMSHSASKFGVRYVPSGTSDGIMSYGATYKDASEAQRAKRKADGYYGRGEYWGKMLGGMAGGLLGPVGRTVGSFLGDKAGDWIKGRLSGRGLYTGGGLYEGRGAYTPTGHNNSLIMNGQPNIRFGGSTDETSGLTISHTEYVGDIFGPRSSQFTVVGFPLNPGLQDIFPLLSQFAQNFEEYEFIQLVFHYRSVVDGSSTNNPDGNTGTIVMATDYTSGPNLFQDKSVMVSSHGAITSRQVEDSNHGVECDPSKNAGNAQKNVRTGLIFGRDISTLDLGRFQIAFSNTPTSFQNRQVGELWVTYTVHLDKPRIFSAAAGNVSQFRGVNSDGVALASNAILGANFLTNVQNSLQPQVLNYNLGANGGVSITFPASTNGTFEIKLFFEGAGVAIAAPIFNTGTLALPLAGSTYGYFGNVRQWNDIYAATPSGSDAVGGLSWFATAAAAFATNGCIVIRVKVTSATEGVNNIVQINPFSNTSTNITQFAMEIMEITPFLAQNSFTDVGLYQSSLGIITAPV